MTFRKGEHLGTDHPRYKGGHIVKSTGYRIIYAAGRRIYEHKHVMETMLGRSLAPGEVIHHIDGDRANNVIRNLMLLPSQSEHITLHQRIGQTDHGRRFTKPPIAVKRPIDMGRLLALYHGGSTDAAIGHELGISRDTIRRRLLDAGIKRRAGRRSQLSH